MKKVIAGVLLFGILIMAGCGQQEEVIGTIESVREDETLRDPQMGGRAGQRVFVFTLKEAPDRGKLFCPIREWPESVEPACGSRIHIKSIAPNGRCNVVEPVGREGE